MFPGLGFPRSQILLALAGLAALAACGGRALVVGATVDSGAAGATAGPPFQPLDVNAVWPGAGCGRPLPADAPRFKHYLVMGTGANLTSTSLPSKAGPRSFWVRVPPNYDPRRPYRVVYLGQGCGAPESANVSTMPLYKESEGGTEQAIYVAVDLPEDDANLDCYDNRDGLSSQEWEAFQLFQRVVDENYCVDLNKIYVAGYGTGGWLANMWGCYFAGWPTPPRKLAPTYHVRAEAVVTGGEPDNNPPCNGPVAAIWIHDEHDVGNPIAGDLAALARVGRMNGCDTTYDKSEAQAPWHPEVAAIGDGVCKTFTGCSADQPVVFCTTSGLGKSDQSERAIPAFNLFFDQIEAGRPDAGATIPLRDAGADAPPTPVLENRPVTSVERPSPSSCTLGSHGASPVGPRLDVAVSGSKVYWTDAVAGQVLSAPVTGGAPSVLVSGEEAPSGIVVRGATVFWFLGVHGSLGAPGYGTVRAVPTTGGAARTVVAGVNDFTVSPDGQTVYWGQGHNVFKAAATAGAAPVVVGVEQGGPPVGPFAVEGTKVVFGVAEPLTGNVSIDVLDVTGVPAKCGEDPDTGELAHVRCTRIARGQSGLGAIVLDNGTAYWNAADHIAANDLTAGAVAYAPGRFMFFGDTAVTQLSLAGDELFFVAGGCLERMALTPNAAPVAVSCGVDAPWSLAVDGARAYWSTGACGIDSAPR